MEIRFFNVFKPGLYVSSLFDIDTDLLWQKGIRGILLDFDNTIVARNADSFSPDVFNWLKLLQKKGFKLCIVSNNRGEKLDLLAGRLKVPVLSRAIKPMRKSFRQAISLMGTSCRETAMIGDQVFTDVLGGNRMGLYTVLVAPLPGHDWWGTALVTRPLERFILARLKIVPVGKREGYAGGGN